MVVTKEGRLDLWRLRKLQAVENKSCNSCKCKHHCRSELFLFCKSATGSLGVRRSRRRSKERRRRRRRTLRGFTSVRGITGSCWRGLTLQTSVLAQQDNAANANHPRPAVQCQDCSRVHFARYPFDTHFTGCDMTSWQIQIRNGSFIT